jgi:hypothetical protein
VETQQTVRLRNTQAVALQLQLLPWGDAFFVSPGSVVDIQAKGPADGMLEIESRPGRIVVYGWVGSVVRVSCDGRDLSSGSRVPATWMD